MELVATLVEHLEVKFQANVKQPSADEYKPVSVITKVYKLETKHTNETLTHPFSGYRLVTNSLMDVVKELGIKDDLSNTMFLSATIVNKVNGMEETVEFEPRSDEYNLKYGDELLTYILNHFTYLTNSI